MPQSVGIAKQMNHQARPATGDTAGETSPISDDLIGQARLAPSRKRQ
jgi:hypothetical protein